MDNPMDKDAQGRTEMTDEQKAQLTVIAFDCARAVLQGLDTITISLPTKKRLPGFPRGELLSVGTNGAHNYAVCPMKVLAWIHSGTKGGRVVDQINAVVGKD